MASLVNEFFMFKKAAVMKKSLRIVIARLGMDAHWRGSIVVAHALRDAGMEVIYIGNQLPKSIVQSAIQESADVIGLSSLSGNHMVLAPEVVGHLRSEGIEETNVVLGGAIPPDDVVILKQAGIKEVFGPGTPLTKIVKFISELK
jgi:methylmalonyl-CoA mutase C-terminal domain/subunit